MACPHLDVRCPAPGRRGAKLGGKPKGGPFHPGGHRRGKTGRVNRLNPLRPVVPDNRPDSGPGARTRKGADAVR